MNDNSVWPVVTAVMVVLAVAYAWPWLVTSGLP